MPYYLKRTDQGGGFVAPPGSRKSYTRTLRRARPFATKDAALADACGNEYPVFVPGCEW